MLRIIQILLLACSIIIHHRECTAIKCYQCSSDKDQDCIPDKVHRKYLKLCPEEGGYFYCRKAVYVHYFMNSRNNDLTIRECAKLYNSQQNECHRGRYNRDSYQFVCECMGHGCNRSLQQSVPAPAAFMSCFLLLIAVFYYQSDSI